MPEKTETKPNYILPILSTIFITYMTFNPNKLTKVPSIIKLFVKTDTDLSYKNYIPSIPNNLSSIWELSQLEYRLREIEALTNISSNKKEEEINKIIQKEKEIMEDGKINAEILHKFPEYLDELNKGGGSYQK